MVSTSLGTNGETCAQWRRVHETVVSPTRGCPNVRLRFPMALDLCRTTEGFYDTASLRSQQTSQLQSVYQKEITLPKRRCPRRGKPKRDNEANEHGKPNDAPTTKPWLCVKTMLCDRQPRVRSDRTPIGAESRSVNIQPPERFANHTAWSC